MMEQTSTWMQTCFGHGAGQTEAGRMRTRPFMKSCTLCLCLFSATGFASDVAITSFGGNGVLTWTNTQLPAVCHVEWASSLTSGWSRSWTELTGLVVTNASQTVAVPMFYRVVSEPFSLTAGLALYLPFTGNTVDHSANGTDGVNSGATLAADKAGLASSAYAFNGPEAQIYVPDATTLDVTAITLSFWFKVTSHETASELVNKFGGGGNIAYGTEIQSSDQKVRFRISSDGSNVTDCPSSTAIVPGVWYHFAGTYDRTTMRVYINGALENSLAKSGNIFNSSDALRIGTYGYCPWWFNGCIDEVAIWGRALDEAEIGALYLLGGHP